MSGTIDRRGFLGQVAGVGLAVATQAVQAQQAPAPAAASAPAGAGPSSVGSKFSAYPFGSQIWVRINNEPFTCYRALPTQKYPYFFPIAGPATGLPMTDESGEPYPHHRSLFLGLDHVNGANYWQEGNDRGQILSEGPQVEVPDDGRVVITDHCLWRQPNQPAVIEDRRTFVLTAPNPRLRFIDADITVTAKVDIKVTQTNHSLFTIRCARSLAPNQGGKLINSNGLIGEKATFGKPANWCGFEGSRCGQVESIVLLDHPGNPWSPCTWFTRDYGNISPTPFNWLDAKGWSLPAGQSIRLRYRVVVQAGAIVIDEINKIFAAFAA